jgi:gliding motility-associated-like protein
VVSFEQRSGGSSYRWDFGDGSAFTNDPNPTHTFDQPGVYTVKFSSWGEGGCVATDSFQVVVKEAATADFSSDPDPATPAPLPDAAIRFIDESLLAQNWFWDFGDGKTSSQQNPTHTYTEAGEYIVTLTVTDAQGCVSSLSAGYTVFAPGVFIPNVFTPNADNINDVFAVEYAGKESYSLHIHDRWGRELFTSDSAGNAWDGEVEGNPAAEGVYFYSLTIGDKSWTGSVTLLR